MQIKIQDIEKFIDNENFNPDYYNWDKSDCSLIGLLKILLKQEIIKEKTNTYYEQKYENLLSALNKEYQ